MINSCYYEIFEKAQKADESFANMHLKAFVHSFVIKVRRARWEELLCKRPKKIFEMSHKLEDVLEKRFCSLTSQVNQYKTKTVGLYYDFSESPLLVTGEDALLLGTDRDAIFSLVAGKKALFFFHEGRVWACSKD